ncbi:uncharacterized protein LOC126162175 isoform X2 [Schistocerca cancellata]|nr:uncharacterized protein LOC126162175 isoform X2 [Schistocerca cancellata]
MNANRAFVEQTVNHLQITAITDHNPQNKKYLDLKKTIRREKDDLLKVTKLIQFQQGIISNLSNCIDNEKMLLSELNNAKKEKK